MAGELELGDHKCPFQSKQFYNSVILTVSICLLLKTKLVGIIHFPLSHQWTMYQHSSVRLNSVATAWDVTSGIPWKKFNLVLKKENQAHL